MVITIPPSGPYQVTSTVHQVQASGIENSSVEEQTSGARVSTDLVAFDAPDTLTHIVTAGGINNSGEILADTGVSQTSNVIVSSGIENTATTKVIVFFPDFSRSAFLSAVVGTTGTIEKFFDRSPFFFTPSEIDPNTLRDISEAQQFLIFTSANIASYETFRRIPSSTYIISSKGNELSDQVTSFTDLFSNGSFEIGNFVNWETATISGSGILEVRSDTPTSAGFPDTGIVPEDGQFWAHIGQNNTGTIYLKQTLRVPQPTPSSLLRNISFQAYFDSPSGNTFQNQLSLIFRNNDTPVSHLLYKFGNQTLPSQIPDDFPDIAPTLLTLPATAAQINSYLRAVHQDMSFDSFTFTAIDVWWIVSNSTAAVTNTLIDNFQLTVDVPPSQLLKTSDLAHIITSHPTASGFPFTISGSDDINQVDLTGPFFDETSPVSGTSFNIPSSQLQFHVKDGGSALDQSNIDVWIDNLQVVNVGTTVTGTVWPVASKIVLASNNIEYIFTRGVPFEQQSTVVVSGELTDFASPSNQTITEYEFVILGSGTLGATLSGFADGSAPIIVPTEPKDLDTQVSPDTQILWSLTDNASGVDPTTVKLILNGNIKLENDVAVGGTFSRLSNSSLGFDYTYTTDSPFVFGETVTGTIQASDFVGNNDSLTYEFTITPDDTLSITNFFLLDGESVLVSSGTEIRVCVEDAVHGVSLGGTTFQINGVVPSGLNVTTSGAGPDKITYSVLVDQVNDFREDLEIVVHAENNFPGPYPVIKEKTFILRPGYDVVWTNRQDGGAESVFSLLTNIQVLAEVKNFAKNFNEGSLFFEFLTQNQVFKDLGATLVSSINVADLPAMIESNNPFFEYGKTFELIIEADDLEGNQLRFKHTFVIEPKPN